VASVTARGSCGIAVTGRKLPLVDDHQPDVEISIVVPCYNSGEWLGTLVERTQPVMEALGRPYELILVNDASPDGATWTAIAKLATTHPWVRGIDLLSNVGQFRALIAGLEAAEGDLVITMDDDLQHPPEEIPKLVAAIDADPELQAVIGAYGDKKHSGFRNLGSRLVSSIYDRVYDKPEGLETTSFRILRRPLVDALVAHRTVKPVIGALILRSTRRIANVPVDHHERVQGRSGWRMRGLVGATIDNVVNASTAPLRFVSTAGILLALFSFLLGAFYFVRGLVTDSSVEGFTTLVVLVIFFGGAIMAAIGLLGEYVVRIVTEVTGQPRYVVRERID
jgi:glycosyltransferase involved in cell wall biosynthesis